MNRLEQLSGTTTKTKWRLKYDYKPGDVVSLGDNIYKSLKRNKNEKPVESSNWRSML